MFLRSIKEVHRLKSKRMSNTYLSNSYCEKADVLSKLRFCKFKNSSPGQFLESSNSRSIEL